MSVCMARARAMTEECFINACTRPNLQVVTGQTLGEVALKVISHVRFGLLDPEKLSQIERDNQQKSFVPVSEVRARLCITHAGLAVRTTTTGCVLVQVSLISAAWKFHALKKVDVSDPQTRPRAGTLPRKSLKVVGLTPQ